MTAFSLETFSEARKHKKIPVGELRVLVKTIPEDRDGPAYHTIVLDRMFNVQDEARAQYIAALINNALKELK